jgi:hypothetical protein
MRLSVNLHAYVDGDQRSIRSDQAIRQSIFTNPYPKPLLLLEGALNLKVSLQADQCIGHSTDLRWAKPGLGHEKQ